MKRLSKNEAGYLGHGDSVVFDPRESIFDMQANKYGLVLGKHYTVQRITPAFKSGEGSLLGWYIHIGEKEVFRYQHRLLNH